MAKRRKLKVVKRKVLRRRLRGGDMGKLGVPINTFYLEDSDGALYRASPKKVIVDCVLSLDTNAYAGNDLLADTQTITDAFRAIDVGGVLKSVTVIDLDFQTAANGVMDLYFLDAAVSCGTENNAPTIGDADAVKVHAKVSVIATDYVNFTGSRIATVGNLFRVLKPISGTKSLAMAVVLGATAAPTHTASGVVVRLGILQD